MDPERSTVLMAEASAEGPGQSALQRTLRHVLDGSIGIEGALVATTEGLLVAAEFATSTQLISRGQAEVVAAMASSAVGIGLHFTRQLGLGDSTACVVQGSDGCVGVQRVGSRGVLVLFGGDGLNMARLNLAVRLALPRVHEVLVDMGV
jgi:predicted regulator of Ras-like GTPase activity (Roadblock/LC7/MglB family)